MQIDQKDLTAINITSAILTALNDKSSLPASGSVTIVVTVANAKVTNVSIS